jgi:hypothetical protein
MYFHWASQPLLKNSRYAQPYGRCLCYKVCVYGRCACICGPHTSPHELRARNRGRGRQCSSADEPPPFPVQPGTHVHTSQNALGRTQRWLDVTRCFTGMASALDGSAGVVACPLGVDRTRRCRGWWGSTKGSVGERVGGEGGGRVSVVGQGGDGRDNHHHFETVANGGRQPPSCSRIQGQRSAPHTAWMCVMRMLMKENTARRMGEGGGR